MATVERIQNAARKGDIVVIQRTRSSSKVHGETTRKNYATVTCVHSTTRAGLIKKVHNTYNGAMDEFGIEIPAWACLIVPSGTKSADILAAYVGQDFDSVEAVRALVNQPHTEG